MNANVTPAISVAVCTFNRATSLAGTLHTIAALRDPGVPWELLVIDNNSTDRTSRIVGDFSACHPVRAIHEARQGLSHARNRALDECRGAALLFTDDDVRLDPGWLAAHADAQRRFPAAGYFGGRILPLWLTTRPRGFIEESLPLIGGLLMWYDLGEDLRPYRDGDLLPYGANLALRRTFFERFGRFRTDLGPVGATPGRGDDDEYLARGRTATVLGVYVGPALCYHVVDPKRLTPRYLYRFGVQKGIAAVRTGSVAARAEGSLLRELDYALKGVWQLLKGRGDRARQCVINMGIQRGLR